MYANQHRTLSNHSSLYRIHVFFKFDLNRNCFGPDLLFAGMCYKLQSLLFLNPAWDQWFDVSFAYHDNNDQTNAILMSYSTVWQQVIAITVHNIPEGLAVGVSFGAIGNTDSATFESARNLAIGIGIQNFPEGLAVSLPLVQMPTVYINLSLFFSPMKWN